MNPNHSPFRRGDKSFYARLARKSVASRIHRHITCIVVLDNPEDEIVPVRSRDTDAGYDVFSRETKYVPAHEQEKFSLGIRVRCPEGYFYKIEDRSSMMRKGLSVRPCIIDATYTGPLSVWLYNRSAQPVMIIAGDRIAQLVFYPQIHVKFDKLSEFSPNHLSDRGDAGYGSTGK